MGIRNDCLGDAFLPLVDCGHLGRGQVRPTPGDDRHATLVRPPGAKDVAGESSG